MPEEEMNKAEAPKEEPKAEPEAKKRAVPRKKPNLPAVEAPAENLPMSKPEELPMAKAEEMPKAERKPVRAVKREVSAGEQLVFGKYSTKDLVIRDPSIESLITFGTRQYPNIYGRRKNLAYYTSHITIVERLINKLMRGGTGKKIGGKVIKTEGRLQGKKLKVMHVVEDAFATIQKNTGKNPLQVLVDALQNSAPIEDTTRVRYGGISYNVAVGISAERRLNVALRNIGLAALVGAFKSRRTLSDTLAAELTMAANKDPNSYAIKKKIELERIARSAR